MVTLLRIDASARQTRSLTRELADRFVQEWMDQDPATTVVHRDVGKCPPTIISEPWISAVFTQAQARTVEQQALVSESDQLIDEVERADVIVIATPMYNYGMPAALKAWIDQVVRIGKTFTFDLARGELPLEPMLQNKTLVLLTSRGEFGFGPGEINFGRDHLTPHIHTVSKFLGANGVHHVGIEYQEFGDARFERSLKTAFSSATALARRLAVHGIEHGSLHACVAQTAVRL